MENKYILLNFDKKLINDIYDLKNFRNDINSYYLSKFRNLKKKIIQYGGERRIRHRINRYGQDIDPEVFKQREMQMQEQATKLEQGSLKKMETSFTDHKNRRRSARLNFKEVDTNNNEDKETIQNRIKQQEKLMEQQEKANEKANQKLKAAEKDVKDATQQVTITNNVMDAKITDLQNKLNSKDEKEHDDIRAHIGRLETEKQKKLKNAKKKLKAAESKKSNIEATQKQATERRNEAMKNVALKGIQDMYNIIDKRTKALDNITNEYQNIQNEGYNDLLSIWTDDLFEGEDLKILENKEKIAIMKKNIESKMQKEKERLNSIKKELRTKEQDLETQIENLKNGKANVTVENINEIVSSINSYEEVILDDIKKSEMESNMTNSERMKKLFKSSMELKYSFNSGEIFNEEKEKEKEIYNYEDALSDFISNYKNLSTTTLGFTISPSTKTNRKTHKISEETNEIFNEMKADIKKKRELIKKEKIKKKTYNKNKTINTMSISNKYQATNFEGGSKFGKSRKKKKKIKNKVKKTKKKKKYKK